MNPVTITTKNDAINFNLNDYLLYDITIADCLAEPEHWIRQLSGKSWMNSRLLAEFVSILCKKRSLLGT